MSEKPDPLVMPATTFDGLPATTLTAYQQYQEQMAAQQDAIAKVNPRFVTMPERRKAPRKDDKPQMA